MNRRLKWLCRIAISLSLAMGFTSIQPGGAALATESEVKPQSRPRHPLRDPQPPKKKVRIPSQSGKFALTFPAADWSVIENDTDEQNQSYDLSLRHKNGTSFVRAHLDRRDNRGIEGSLIKESNQAKYLLEYDPESVEPKISTEDYEAEALFCGRKRQGPAGRACSLVKVALHGREVVKIHSLIDAETPLARKRLQEEVEAIFASLELIEMLPIDSAAKP